MFQDRRHQIDEMNGVCDATRDDGTLPCHDQRDSYFFPVDACSMAVAAVLSERFPVVAGHNKQDSSV